MPKINFVCPVCKKKESFDVDPEAIQSSTRNPVPIVITHGTPEHAITIFVDKDYRVRATSVADIVQRIEQMESHSGQFEKKHIPTPKEERVSLSGLDNAQVTIVALADGKKSVEELAHILDLPLMRVQILCQQLVKLGKLESVKVVIEEK